MGTHVSEESWFSRIGNAFKGILVGILLTVVSVPVLFWNEGRAVKTAKGLQEGAKVVVDIQPDKVDSANEKKFIHTTGDVQTSDVLRDDEFTVEFNGVRLVRHVEMYQWNENEDTTSEKKIGGGTRKTTTYTYEKGWFPRLIDSSDFDEAQSHQNPTEVLFPETTQQAKNVTLGNFRLPDSLIGMIHSQETVELDASNFPNGYANRSTIRKDGPNGAPRIYISATTPQPSPSQQQPLVETIETAPPANPDQPELSDLESTVTSDEPSQDPEPESAAESNASPAADPQIGDVRVWFTATPVQTVSVLTQQIGDSFQPYSTEYGTTINVLRAGVYSADEMIKQEEAANRTLTWILRGVGSMVMFFGLTLLLRPLVVLADVLPIAGSLVGFGTAIVAGLLTIAGSLTVIGIAWLFYRPLLGGTLLVVAAAALFMIVRRGRSSRPRQPETLTDADLA